MIAHFIGMSINFNLKWEINGEELKLLQLFQLFKYLNETNFEP